MTTLTKEDLEVISYSLDGFYNLTLNYSSIHSINCDIKELKKWPYDMMDEPGFYAKDLRDAHRVYLKVNKLLGRI